MLLLFDSEHLKKSRKLCLKFDDCLEEYFCLIIAPNFIESLGSENSTGIFSYEGHMKLHDFSRDFVQSGFPHIPDHKLFSFSKPGLKHLEVPLIVLLDGLDLRAVVVHLLEEVPMRHEAGQLDEHDYYALQKI